MSSGRSAPLTQKSPIGSACAVLAFITPFLLAARHVSGSAQWDDDLRVVESLGLVPIGARGSISGVLVQLASLLPIGGRLLRANLVSGLALAICGLFAYRVAERLLWRAEATPRLGPLLALSASLAATLSSGIQAQASLLASTTFASALALLLLLVRPGSRHADARVWLGCGALLAIITTENQLIGALLFAALVVQLICLAELPSRRELWMFLVGFGTLAGICLLPIAVRAHADHGWLNLGLNLSPTEPEAMQLPSGIDALREWRKDTGMLALVLAAVGAAAGLLRRRTRWLVMPLVVWIVADVVFSSGSLFSVSFGSFRILALVALSILGALGVQAAVALLRNQALPFAEAAAVLLVVFHFTLALIAIEDSGVAAREASGIATDTWTEEALGKLPPRSLVLVRNTTLAWRFWSARVVRGERPDVVVVPTALLDRGSVAADLLALEPGLGPLIREVSVSGLPSELALSNLADLRPLFLELDPRWDTRLLEHIVPAPLWLRFIPQPQGRSDRARTLDAARTAFSQTLETIQRQPGAESSITLSILGEHAREQAVLLGALGDRESLGEVLDDIQRITHEDTFAVEMKKRLAERDRGRVDVQGLLN